MMIRILLAKPGLDVHDRGIRMIARACRDAGMEVVYLDAGLYTVEQIAAIAVQESVDVVGLSIMTGSPSRICGEVLAELGKRGADRVPIVCGGVIRQEEIGKLEAVGVKGVFMAGASLEQAIGKIREVVHGNG